MDGIHDLGGMHGFGVVPWRRDAPAFHERWEATVFAMMLATARAGHTGNADRFRHAIERVDPVAYLDHGYYGRWLGAIETLLVEAGVLEQATIDRRAHALGARPDARVAARPSPQPDQVPPARQPRNDRTLTRPPRYQLGDQICTCTEVKAGHTRLPRYARGKTGTILACHGGWVYPDTHAHGQGEQPEHLYTVAFSGQALWGHGADPHLKVHLDLFEPYLEQTP